jgi:MoaA/NifB/PqqE/SkfB family radical SAM enzyme
MISDEEFFVRTNINTVFLAKRRKWSFSSSFVVGGNEVELTNCFRTLAKLGVKKMNIYPSSRFPRQKIRILDAYNNARELLRGELRKFPRMEIK